MIPRYWCIDCWADLRQMFLGEYYMIRWELWAQSGGGDGQLCILCLEERLGRRLTRADFLPVPVNSLFGSILPGRFGHRRSDLLLRRMLTR